MNALLDLLSQPLTHRLGWVLVHSLWQGALAAALFGLLRTVLRRRSAQTRYVAGCVVLLALALAPVVTFLTLPGQASDSTGTGLSQPPASPKLILEVPRLVPVFGSGAGAPTLAGRALEVLDWLLPWLVAGWTMGVLFFSLRLLQGCWHLKRLRCDQTGTLDPAWVEILNDLRCRLNISRPVRLLKSGLVEVPTVLGWLRPLILLPASSVTGLTPAQLEAILAHELAHFLRYDYLVNAFQLVVETLMFYHPAAWWISSCIREERELCCDDVVLQVCNDRVVYARALATLEELRAPSTRLAFAASGGPLLKRIRRLIGAAGEDRPATAREMYGLALVGIGLVLIITGICLLMAPPAYQAIARVKIERDTSAQLTSNDGKGFSLSIYDPYFIQTEFEVLQSDVILSRVVSELNLNQQWGERYGNGGPLKMEEAVAVLRARLRLRPVRSTSLFEICVSSDKSNEAAEIANAIAATYKSYRWEQRRHAGLGGIVTLEERFKKQEREIEEEARKLSELREQLQIPDAAVNADGPALLLSAETLRKIEVQRIESKTELVKQETMLKELKKLNPDDLIQALPTAVQDNLLGTLIESKSMAEQALVIKKKEFGPEHVEIIKLNSQLEDLKDKIKKRVNGIIFALDARVSALGKSLEGLEAEVQSATTKDIAKAHQSQPYYDAKRRLEQLQRFNQVLTVKIASEKIDVDLPKSAMVEIVDRAIAPSRAVSPNRYRAISCSALGLLMALVGIVMVKGAGHRRNTEPKMI
jgi:uncharacterized protein involved in exopolysaccharide biosynthesis/Zn-dependent protease with chaperone function